MWGFSEQAQQTLMPGNTEVYYQPYDCQDPVVDDQCQPPNIVAAENYEHGNEFCHQGHNTGPSAETDPLALTPDSQLQNAAINIYVPCVSNLNTDALLSRVYNGPDRDTAAFNCHGKKKLSTPQKRRPSTAVSRFNRPLTQGQSRGGRVVYVTVRPFAPPKGPKIGQIARTSTSSRAHVDLNHSRFYAVSRAEEIAAETAARRGLGLAPKPAPKSALEVASKTKRMESVQEINRSKSANHDAFSIPRLNSSRSSASKIQTAVEDFAKIPEQVERVVAMRMEDPSLQTKLFQMATKKLNIPTSTRLYRNLPDIETLPEVNLKRVASKTKKELDPAPSIEDYVTPKYSRVQPPGDVPPATKTDSQPSMDMNRNLNELDLIQFERVFISI